MRARPHADPERRWRLEQEDTDARRTLRSLLALFTVATILGVLFGAASWRRALHVYLLVLVGLTAASVVIAATARFGRIERAPRLRRSRAAATQRLPAFYERAERRLEVASVSMAQFELLRVRLREVADQRLVRHGFRMATEEARRVLGERAFSLLQVPPAGDRFAPGPTPAEIAEVIEALERV